MLDTHSPYPSDNVYFVIVSIKPDKCNYLFFSAWSPPSIGNLGVTRGLTFGSNESLHLEFFVSSGNPVWLLNLKLMEATRQKKQGRASNLIRYIDEKYIRFNTKKT